MLYKCPACHHYYTLNESSLRELDKCDDDHPFVEFIVLCECGSVHGVGGEYDITPDDTAGISMFSFDAECRLPEIGFAFPALMLEETIKDNKLLSTYDGDDIIYLRPKYVDTIEGHMSYNECLDELDLLTSCMKEDPASKVNAKRVELIKELLILYGWYQIKGLNK